MLLRRNIEMSRADLESNQTTFNKQTNTIGPLEVYEKDGKLKQENISECDDSLKQEDRDIPHDLICYRRTPRECSFPNEFDSNGSGA